MTSIFQEAEAIETWAAGIENKKYKEPEAARYIQELARAIVIESGGLGHMYSDTEVENMDRLMRSVSDLANNPEDVQAQDNVHAFLACIPQDVTDSLADARDKFNRTYAALVQEDNAPDLEL